MILCYFWCVACCVLTYINGYTAVKYICISVVGCVVILPVQKYTLVPKCKRMSWSWPWPLIYRQMASLATYLCAKVEVCSHLFLKYRGGLWHHMTVTDKNFTHFSRSPFSVFAVCTNMAQQFTLPLTINWQFFGSQLRIINYTGWHIKMSPVQNDCGLKTKTWSSVPPQILFWHVYFQ